MSAASLKGLRVAVAGAGVLGLSIAVRATCRGAEVVVFDPAVLGDNASGVAAGMLSPGLEAVLDEAGPLRFALFLRAYAEWPAFAAETRTSLHDFTAGACLLGETSKLEAAAERLRVLDVDAQPLSAAQVHARQPLSAGDEGGLLIREDGRLDPRSALNALSQALTDAGGRRVTGRLAPGRVPEGFDRLVIAAGDEARAWVETAPELSRLTPIKGHILSFAMARASGPTLRGNGGYLAPQGDRVVFGATMEAGRADRTLDAAVAADLRARAVALAPVLDSLPWTASAGVRAATPDGLPLVGVSAGGPVLAVGARRNGWLLAPLVAEAAVEALAGAAPWRQFDPARFGAA